MDRHGTAHPSTAQRSTAQHNSGSYLACLIPMLMSSGSLNMQLQVLHNNLSPAWNWLFLIEVLRDSWFGPTRHNS